MKKGSRHFYRRLLLVYTAILVGEVVLLVLYFISELRQQARETNLEYMEMEGTEGRATYAQASYFTLYPVAPNAADQWDKVEEWNETAESSVLLGFNFDRTNVETQIANCSLVMDRYKKELYTGTRDPEEAVPALYADLEKAGLEDIRAEYQAQVDTFLASK